MRVRAMMLNNYGAYQFNIVRDTAEAVRLTTEAGALDPASCPDSWESGNRDNR